ncbi:RHS repeat-associated core domain-containing protein [uncultured Winogradskyella sp.]|uniref:RHS repeat domain-containing protein n=1 Tax=uncultured Winogradskyella sp. TaxID=395353 RepID=UPI00260ACC97|nr:RHS repeat-associated core domain-containing protein [uncultured Winogradskyella sp.]
MSTGTTTEYVGNYIYENNSLKMFSHPEGYSEPIPSGKIPTYRYIYQFKDHLGNVRLTYADSDGNGSINSSTEIIEENNYYPFGLKHKGYNDIVSANVNSVASKFKYNGKELDEDLGLNLYHYGFRLYDPAIGRFPSIDPISDKFPHVSTYNYAENEPVGSIDLWGLQRWKVNGRERTKEYTTDQKHSAQRSLALQNPTYAYRLAFVVGNKSKVDKNTITATSHRLSYTARGITETNGIRHSLWSALITSKYDSGFAESVGNAHEGLYMMDSSEIDFSKDFEGDSNLADSVIDLLNNEIGRRIGEENEGESNKDIMMKVLDKALEDGLWSSKKDKKGNITIFRKKLKKSQYNRIVERLNNLDDNGRPKDEEDE